MNGELYGFTYVGTLMSDEHCSRYYEVVLSIKGEVIARGHSNLDYNHAFDEAMRMVTRDMNDIISNRLAGKGDYDE